MSEPALLDAPAAPPPAAAPSGPLVELILVRLLPATKTAPKSLVVRKQISDLFAHAPSEEQYGDAIRSLRASGLLSQRGQRLTPAGRARALTYLGVAELPPRCTWQTLLTKFLVPMALGVTQGSDEAVSLSDSKTLVPRLLKREHGLPEGTKNSSGAVLEALACRALGFPELSSLEELKRVAYAKALGEPLPLSKLQAQRLMPRKLLGAKTGRADSVRSAVLVRLTSEKGPTLSKGTDAVTVPEAVADDFDLEAFARTVVAAARACPTGRFGDNKVFISHVWRELRDQPQVARLGPDGFKAKLTEANHARLLTLSRADLVHLMDPNDVRESETGHGSAASHFVLIEGA